ncbi:MAG: HAD family hydrolase [Bacteroidia bacterium]|nr:HAD family hydrolase [Bacteroidia bacterium]
MLHTDSQKPKNCLAAFDFDGTITTKDSGIEFIRFTRGTWRLFWSGIFLSPTLLFWKMGLYPREMAKERFLKWHFGGKTITEMKQKGQAFAKEVIPNILRPQAIERIEWHKEQGHKIVIITASLDFWVRPWAESQGFSCIATVPKVEQGRFTGQLGSPNCYGQEKVDRLKNSGLPKWDFLFAYGDTAGDKELLAFADQSEFKPFR